MFMFSARYKNQIQSILIHKDLKVNEFLDALSYSLQLPDGVIVGFQDRSGLIITPSFIVANPQEIKNEPYEVMLKSQPLNQSHLQQPYSQSYPVQNQNLSSSQASTLLLDTSAQMQQPLFNRQQQLAGGSLYDSVNPYQSPAFGGPIQSASGLNSRSFHGTQSAANNDRTVLMGSGALNNNFASSLQQPAQQQFSNSFINNNDVQSQLNHQNDIILFVSSLQTDTLLTENIKNKIISKARLRDSGIYGAYQLYLVDGDVESFKARVIHRALTPPTDYPSTATTVPLNWNASRASTQGGFRPQTRENSRMRGGSNFAQSLHQSSVIQGQHNSSQHQQQPVPQDRYLPIILELENKGMIDEQTGSLLKTLILEENLEVFRVINSYIAKAVSDRELSFKLTRLAQQLSNYIERPQSPLPRKKNQLLNYVNSLTRYHFNDPDDIQLLNKLIHEENEFILSCFDVFESDKDHDNLIDSLHRILEKSKAMGLHANSLTASSFYNQNPWTRSNQQTPFQPPINQSYSQSSIRQAQPYISKWEERGTAQQVVNLNNLSQSHFANQSNIPRSSERPHGAVGGRRNMNTSQAHAHGGSRHHQANLPPPSQFQNTTVHNVALIPNYFSSGEEEGPIFQQQQMHFGNGSRAHSRLAHGGQTYQPPQYGQNNFRNNPYTDNNTYGQREFLVKEEYSDDLSRGSRKDGNKKHNQDIIPTNQSQKRQQYKKQQQQDYQVEDDQEEEDSEAQEIIDKSRSKKHQAARGKSQAKHNKSEKSEKKGHTKDTKKKRRSTSTSSEEGSSDSVDEKDKKSKSKKLKQSKNKKKRAASSSSSESSSSKSSQSDSNSDSSSQHDKKKSSKKAKASKKDDKKSSSKHTKDQKSDKKNTSKKATTKPIITQEEINEIMEDEEIEKILRQENMALLTLLIREQDQDLLNSFVKYQQDDDSEYLISFIESKTEDALQYLVMQNFSNEENAKIRQLRSQRNEAIRRAFKKFRKSLDTQKLVNGIRKILPQIVSPVKQGMQSSAEKPRVFKEPSRKEKLESIFNMIFHAEFSRNENVAKKISKLFHQDQDPTLLNVFENYQKHNNYLELKNQVEEYMRDKVQGFEKVVKEDPELPISITEAINLFSIRGEIGYQDQQLLLELYRKGDKHLLASWEAFKVIKKMDDLLDTLLVLCEVKKEEEKQQKLKQQQQKSTAQQNQDAIRQQIINGRQNAAEQHTAPTVQQTQTNQVQAQSVSLFGGNRAPTSQQNDTLQPASKFTLMKTNEQQPSEDQKQQQLEPQQRPGGFSIRPAGTYQLQVQQQQQQEEVQIDERRSDQNLNIDHNPDDSDVEDFQSIIDYQHKILRKYTIRGFIKYSDAPIFHEMVDQKDYKMISIFEVFAINRDEDDFLENLGLLAQIFLEQENEHNTTISEALDTEQPTLEIQEEFPSQADLQDPRIATIHSFRDKLTPEEHKWCIQAVKDNLKNLIVVIQVWNATKDDLDLIHSLKKIYKLKSGGG